MNKQILDVTDIDKEFEQLENDLKLLQKRFIAIALDYKYYIDGSLEEREIFKLRDNVSYRFFSASLHTQLLIRQHFVTEKRLVELFNKDSHNVLGQYFPENPHFAYAEKEISSIFDSVLYHLVSVFDYFGTLTNYICVLNGKKQDTMKWTNVTRTARDKSNQFSQKNIAESIKKLDNEFVNKLYEYRSVLIHERAELNRHSFTFSFKANGGKDFTARFIASEKLLRQFSELKKLSNDNYITIKYVAFWLMKKSIEMSTEMLFALKQEMEQNPPKIVAGTTIAIDPKTNRMVSPSIGFWNVENQP